jgi:cell division protein FtsB
MVADAMLITRQRKRSILQLLWLPLLTAAVLSYFGYHTFHGDFGIWARDRLEAEAERLSIERNHLAAERAALEVRVATVRPESLDADVVDMLARKALGVMRADEVIVRLGAAQQ